MTQSSDAAVSELFEGEAGIASHEVPSTARQIVTGIIAVLAMVVAFVAVVYLVAQVVELLFPLWAGGAVMAVFSL